MFTRIAFVCNFFILKIYFGIYLANLCNDMKFCSLIFLNVGMGHTAHVMYFYLGTMNVTYLLCIKITVYCIYIYKVIML